MEDNNKEKKGFWMTFGKALGCHQRPERSFSCCQKQFFLCARCTGIFVGELLIAPILYILTWHFNFYTIFLLIPLIIDGTLQYYKNIMSNNIRRLITGLLAGYGIGIFIIHLLVQIFRH